MSIEKHHLVYLASTAEGLELERYELERTLARQNMINSGFAYRTEGTQYDWDLVRKQIERSELFILLLSDDYGPMTPTGISYLHREFVHAASLGKPVIAFMKNSLPSGNLTEEQQRLSGFHRMITEQAWSYKWWHLLEELLSHVKTTLSSQALLEQVQVHRLPGEVSESVENQSERKPTPQQRMIRMRQVISLQVAAKVYEAGNLSREEVLLPVRLDQLLSGVLPLLRVGASEDRLRSQLEAAISNKVSEQLLRRHAKAHAVDDVRISRGQFQKILTSWESLGLIISRENKGRTLWSATELI